MLNFKDYFVYVAIVTTLTSVVSGSTISCTFTGQAGYVNCDANTVEAVTAENQAITISGTYDAGLSANDVYSLMFNDNDVINYYPNKISDTFSNMNSINVFNSQLNTLTTNAFTKCSKLQSIGIGNNNFPTIPASFAESCTELMYLNIYQNGIKTIHKDAFKGLEKVQQLMLFMNNVTKIEPGTFQPLKNLWYLMLSYNQISEIDSETFVGLTNLTYVDLMNNHIKVLPKFNFDTTRNIQYLQFYYNNITAIQRTFNESYPVASLGQWQFALNFNECIDDYFNAQKPMTIENSPNLTTCYNNYDLLVPPTTTTKIPVSGGSGSGSALCAEHKDCRFFLDQNRKYTCVLENVDLLLTSIGGDHVSGFTDADVKKVYVVDSTLYNIPRVIFDKFGSVEFLSVSHAEMTILNDNTFEACGANLSILDASNNQIREVTENALILCQSLVTLDLTNNPVEEFKSGVFEADKSLKHVIMSRVIPALP